jgi:Ser/Thr protein kinase RdoA (MazF antagonist)
MRAVFIRGSVEILAGRRFYVICIMLSVSSSIVSPAALAGFLVEKYHLEAPQCSLLRAGINHSYLVNDAEQRFVFRIYSLGWRSETEIREELRLLRELHIRGLSVSYGIEDRCGELLQEIDAPEGLRHAVLFTYAPGRKIIDNGLPAHHETGRLMARMHLASAQLQLQRTSYSYETLVLQSLPKLEAFLPADCKELLEFKDLLERIRPLVAPALEALPRGMVHLDVWFDNLNVDADGTITLFDFDFCGNGILALDPAYYLMQLYVLYGEKYAANAAAFLEGYESLRPLNEDERKALPALGILLYCFYLGVQCERFENFSSVFISETYLKRYITMRIMSYAQFQGLN